MGVLPCSATPISGRFGEWTPVSGATRHREARREWRSRRPVLRGGEAFRAFGRNSISTRAKGSRDTAVSPPRDSVPRRPSDGVSARGPNQPLGTGLGVSRPATLCHARYPVLGLIRRVLIDVGPCAGASASELASSIARPHATELPQFGRDRRASPLRRRSLNEAAPRLRRDSPALFVTRWSRNSGVSDRDLALQRLAT